MECAVGDVFVRFVITGGVVACLTRVHCTPMTIDGIIVMEKGRRDCYCLYEG